MPAFNVFNLNTDDVPRFYRRGVRKTLVNTYADETTTTSGVATFYLTNDKTVTGTPLFTEQPMATFYFNDPTADIGCSASLSPDFVTLTVTMKQQSPNLVTILGVSVIGSISMINVPNGTVVDVMIEGK